MQEIVNPPVVKRPRGNPNWVKGVGGNPSGKAKDLAKVIEAVDHYALKAVMKIYRIMTRGKSEMAQLRAAEMILDRSSLGKPKQAVHHTGTIEHVDGTAARDRLEGLLDRLASRAGEGHPTAH